MPGKRERERERKTERQTDRQTDRKTDRKTDMQECRTVADLGGAIIFLFHAFFLENMVKY